MKSLKNLTGDSLEQLIDYSVVDQNGDEIGTLHSLWSDPDTGAVEFLGVKTGWLFGHNHVVPAGKAELDEATNVVRLPYTEAFIKEAPSMSADSEISEEEETTIYGYYGMARGESSSAATGTSSDSVPEAAGASARAEASGADGGASQFGAPTAGLGASGAETVSDGGSSGSSTRWRRTSRPGEVTAASGAETAMGSGTGVTGFAGGTTGSATGDSVRAALDDLSPSDSSGTREPSTSTSAGSYGTTNLYGSTGTSSPVSADAMGSGMLDDFDAAAREGAARDAAREAGGANLDPITGEPGAHPVGTGVGAAGGGVTGAAIGMAIGGPIGAPVGAVVGGVVGAIGGGLAGKGVAESINPTEENAYWQGNYQGSSYFENDYDYADYAPAYKTGYEGYARYAGTNGDYASAEPDLRRDYEQARGGSRLEWEKAKAATRDAWERLKAKASDATK